MLRGGGKQKARNRPTKQLYGRKSSPKRSSPRRSSPRRSSSSRRVSPLVLNLSNKRVSSSGRRSRSSAIRISSSKSLLILSTLVHALAAQGSYSAPTEFFLNTVAGCTSHTSSCFNRVETATHNKFQSMSAKNKMQLSWARDQVRYEHFRDREFPGRKPAPSGGAKISGIVDTLKWLGIAGVTASTVKWVLSRPAMGSRGGSGVMLPQIGYSQHGPWKQ